MNTETIQQIKVSVLIPAFNEEERIYDTVKSAAAIPMVSQIFVIDDGSADQTAMMAKKAGAIVKKMESNKGKGAALNAGANLIEGNIVLLLDADLGSTAIHATPLLNPVIQKKADMTIAIFPSSGKKGGFGFVKRLARNGIKKYAGIEVTAPLSGQRAMTIQAFQTILPFAQGYGVEVAATIKVAQAGYHIQEVLLPLAHKETGRDLKGFIHRGKQFKDVFFTLRQMKYHKPNESYYE